jgi:hypothetical protein
MFCLVELRGLEPLTPCLQIDVFARATGAELARELPLSIRGVPLVTLLNGTLMARRSRCIHTVGPQRTALRSLPYQIISDWLPTCRPVARPGEPMPSLTAGYSVALVDLARVWHATVSGASTTDLLIRRDQQTHPLPGNSSSDLPECCSAMRKDCRRYVTSCGQNPARAAWWTDRVGRPTTVKP